MNRLPAVLQKEIWEYVHGDRAFWKTQYDLVVDEINQVVCRTNQTNWVRTPDGMIFHAKILKDVLFEFPKSFKRWRKDVSFFTPDKPWEFPEWVSVWFKWPGND